MIEKDPPFFWDVSCDKCSVGEERLEADDFYDVVKQIKEIGWKIIKKKDEWYHYCPSCLNGDLW